MKCPQFEEFHRREVLKLKEEESLFPAVALESKKNDRMMTKTDKYIASELLTYRKNEVVEQKMTEESENVSVLKNMSMDNSFCVLKRLL